MKDPWKMDEFELAGLDYTIEEKNEIIEWCNNHNYSIAKEISLLAYKKYTYINKQYLIELKYKKVRNKFTKRESSSYASLLSRHMNCTPSAL
jgi:hypothetical protein